MRFVWNIEGARVIVAMHLLSFFSGEVRLAGLSESVWSVVRGIGDVDC